MTDLTDKWKKGELPSGYYYVKNEFGNIFPSDYSEDYDCISDTVIKDFFTEVSEIKEVIEPVPSYEKFLSLTYAKEEDEKIIAEYEQENAQLKELLKETKKREDIIRKQLKDAQKVMIEDYYSLDYLKGVLSRQEIGNYTAQESLEKIAHDWEKGLDKYCKKWCEIKY